ncbi:hypothetical protein [Methanolacinia petrolearia]|uniref:hypothetical protein n=1 Tax=Methanolacinia petrolearia TaxID=54120 RepID=UPI003BAD49CB
MLDFEAGQVYGIKGRQINIPTEIGVVLYDPGADSVYSRQKKFFSDIDLVVRKNVVDGNGVKTGFSVVVVNQGKDLYDIKYDRRYRAGTGEIRRSIGAFNEVHRSVKDYMAYLEREFEISSFWFFPIRWRSLSSNMPHMISRDMNSTISRG